MNVRTPSRIGFSLALLCAALVLASCEATKEQAVDRCLPVAEMCDGLDNDCDGLVDEDTAGTYYSVFQQPTQSFNVGAIRGTTSAVDYYAYGGETPLSSHTPNFIEREDALVIFLHEDPEGARSLGLIFDVPVPPSGGGISTATGGAASLDVAGPVVSVDLLDDGADTSAGDGSVSFDWSWRPGHTDGAVLRLAEGQAFCVTISPMNLDGIERVLFWDGRTKMHVPFDSSANPITICSVSCCSPTGDEVCDGIDNDCDGEIDEDIAPSATTCGEGVCLAEGEQRCVDGELVDSCVPGAPTGPDDDCDGIDNDCDGAIDDGFVATETTCGAGVCASTGEMLCEDGVLRDTCAAGEGTPEDCNGLDDDCDGEIDEELASRDVTCGEGVCERDGKESCVNGGWLLDCQPGTPLTDVDECNGLDDDCDGAVDEDYIPRQTFCGFGGCANTGFLACQDGEIVDTCAPLTPTAERCDGRDNDCDGEIDEFTSGVFFTLFQQPTQTFPFTAVESSMSGVDYYGYDAGAPQSSHTPDYLERENALVLWLHEGPSGDHTVGMSLDQPFLPGDGGMSQATGGSAQLAFNAPGMVPLFVDDASDAFDADLNMLSWSWQPGQTDGAVLGGSELPFCMTLSPLYFAGVDRILVVDGSTGEHYPLDSLANPVTICSQFCCADDGEEICDGQDNDCDGQVDEGCHYTLSEFVATAAEVYGSPSLFAEDDTRAGSLELNFNGAHGYDGEFTDPAFGIGILSLRNGLGQIVEQQHINRRWPPSPLDAEGCEPDVGFPRCWITPDENGAAVASVPERCDGSNVGFDPDSLRVEVGGKSIFDLSGGDYFDNSHEAMLITWTAPRGLDQARLQFRGRYDWNLDGLDDDDPMVPLFSRQWAVGEGDVLAPCVTVEEETDTTLTIRVNVGDATGHVRRAYLDADLVSQ